MTANLFRLLARCFQSNSATNSADRLPGLSHIWQYMYVSDSHHTKLTDLWQYIRV